jgi:hypothetical protein
MKNLTKFETIMQRIKLTKLIIILLIISFNFISTKNLFAQTLGASPLNPGKTFTQKELGIFVGLGQNIQSGYYNTGCDSCNFDSGNGFGFKAGLLYEFDLSPTWQLGAAVGLNVLNVVSSFLDYRALLFTSQVSQTKEMVNVMIREKSETGLVNLTVMPFIKWSPSNSFFVRMGVEAGYLVYSHVRHTEELTQKTALLSSGEIGQFEFKDFSGNVAVVREGEYSDINKFQIYLVPAIGVNIELAKNVNLTPVFDFGYPLTSLSTKGDGFKVLNWRILFELRVALQKRFN